MITYCENCQHVEPSTRKGQPWGWLCMKHKNAFDSPLSETIRTNPPYLRCKDVNGGLCELYEERKYDGIRNEE